MQSQIRYPSVLPLAGESGFSRRIFIDSCKIDAEHIQVRGELVDNRADYQNNDEEIAVHGMVVRLTYNVNTGIITRSEMALPQMAFEDICAQEMPAKAEELEGSKVGSDFNQKVAEIFGATRGCMHLMTLYRAIGMALNQASSWNHTFRGLDENCQPQNVVNVMTVIHSNIVDTCHAWQSESGGVSRDFAANRYGPMLERCTPKLFGRWQQYEQDKK
jgi:Protein of unknown function (DUF2889)